MDILKSLFSDYSTLGLIVLTLTIFAMWLVGGKNRYAFVVFTISQFIQIHIFWNKGQGFLILTMILLIIFNVINYFKWSK